MKQMIVDEGLLRRVLQVLEATESSNAADIWDVAGALRSTLEQPVIDSTLSTAVWTVLEGFTLPPAVRKILEAAYYTNPQPEPVSKCAQCKKEYKHCSSDGCPKCAPGVVVPESEFRQPITSQAKQEPFGHVTVRWLSRRYENHMDQYTFYLNGQPPYLDNADECIPVFTSPQHKAVVKLTPEEQDYWIGSNTTKQALCRAIEAAVIAKNGLGQ